jgi:three-Cys-motif partner protein
LIDGFRKAGMPGPMGVVWPIEPHTLKKHEILRRYLDAWLGILGQSQAKIIYVDGFAGPGGYAGGEPGSPIIAIDRAISHELAARIRAKIVFHFVELDPARAQNLRGELAKRWPEAVLKKRRIRYQVYAQEFASNFSAILDRLEADDAKLAPTFAFLDPFGFSGIPMKLIARILQYKRCEVLVTFMEGFVNRFADPTKSEALTELFGSNRWEEGLEIASPEKRKDFWIGLYRTSLHELGGAKFVTSFEMLNRFNQTEYYLVYGTNHWKGLEVMKEAMWKVDPTGQYSFRDTSNPDQRLLLDYADVPTWGGAARELLWNRFQGETIREPKLHEFVITHTPYVYRKKFTLWALEDEGKIVNRGRRHAFPEGCVIEFAR